MQNNYTILFIDDHSSNYVPTLEPAAKAAGYQLAITDNVLDGIDYLKNYVQIIRAIILDISFPKGEIQGLEALQKIKLLHPDLPVIMLTDRDSAEDIDRVVDCIKKGAYNYVAKRSLNPVYLFQVIDSAVQLAQMQVRLNSQNIIPNDNKQQTFYTVANTSCYGLYTKSSVFGFELVSVNKPSNEQEQIQLQGVVMQWHQNLLKSISNIYLNEIQINLKYIAEKRKIKCCILFTVYAKSEKHMAQILTNLKHDIDLFFFASINDSNHPYIFEEITNDNFLINVNTINSKYKHTIFYRNPVTINAADNVGFHKVTKNSTEEDINYQPNELFPLPTKFSFDNELLKALLNQNEYAEIDVQLVPKNLMKEEIDLILHVIKSPNFFNTQQLSNDEIKLYKEYLQKFISAGSNKFLASVILKRSSENWEQHLKTGVLNYFFGSHEGVGYQLRKPENLLRFCTTDKGTINQLPFFYSIHDVMQIFRLPVPDLNDLPGIKQQSNVFHQLPDNLPQEGILLGLKSSGKLNYEVKIAKQSLARHLYIMGQTGTGKSTLLKTMINDCLNKNEGFAVIDPHGDLYDEVLKIIPKNKKKRVIVINTVDPDNSAKHNPIGYDENNPQSKSLVINELIRIFRSIYNMDHAGGPMFELYFKNGLLLVLNDAVQAKLGVGTILDFVRLFFDDEYRKELLQFCDNKRVLDFFKVAEKNSGDWSFPNFATWVTSKLTRFTEDFYLTPIISNKKGNVNYRKLIDDGNILLVKMDKGLIGEDNVSLLGQMILSSIILAAMSRGDLDKENRRPFYLFIDEFQNFIKGNVGSALSEVRKYGLSLTLANQTLGQLKEEMVEALLGNVGSLIFFRPGINDYEKIRNYIEPEFTRESVLKLPNFNCIARLQIDNIPSDPFVFQTINN